MKPTIVFFITIALGYARGSIQRFTFPVDKNSNYDNTCRNANETISFPSLPLKSINENFLSSSTIYCLDLSDNRIESVDPNAFNNLPNLKYLNMSYNKFDINNVLNHGHLNLETLILDNIENNCEYRLNVNIEGVYPKLKKLFVRNECGNINFDSSFKTAFPSLTHLYLCGNNKDSDHRYTDTLLQSLPNTMEYLDLSSHSLSNITLQNLDNLQYLIINEPYDRRHKRLRILKLQELMNLKYLSAFSNGLNDDIESLILPSLIFLDISNNYIRLLQKNSLYHVTNLQFLNISGNCIRDIKEDAFDHLVNLEVLDLKQNLIDEIPRFSNAKLRILFLNCNRLRGIPPGIFKSVTNLETLDLHDNQISHIGQESFSGLGNLKTLNLENNALINMPQNWMIPLVKLKVLHLGKNKFQGFENLTLDKSSQLENLYWSVPSSFKGLKSLENIPENVTISFVDSSNSLAGECTNFYWEHCIRRYN